MPRIKITDISRELNVAISTVNKALNGKAGVSEEKRQLIIETAARMGYKPNRAASSLARSRIKIGLVIPDNYPQYYGIIRDGILFAFDNLSDYNVTDISKYY